MSLSGFAFAEGGFDRAGHLREAEEALDALWPRARVLLLDGESRALVPGELPAWPLGAALRGERPRAALFLGMAGDTPCFALEERGEGRPVCDLREAGMRWPGREASLFAAAAGVLNWQRRARHCGGCGARVELRQGGWSVRCPACGLEAYPRTDPAVIVAVSSGERLLLGRQARWPAGRWSVIAGFIEPGESLSQAVAREVFEETGVRVQQVRFAAAQPWPFPSALMLGCFAEAAPDAPDPVVGEELEDARWFSREEVAQGLAASDAPATGEPPPIAFSPRLSIARALIEAWHARASG